MLETLIPKGFFDFPFLISLSLTLGSVLLWGFFEVSSIFSRAKSGDKFDLDAHSWWFFSSIKFMLFYASIRWTSISLFSSLVADLSFGLNVDCYLFLLFCPFIFFSAMIFADLGLETPFRKPELTLSEDSLGCPPLLKNFKSLVWDAPSSSSDLLSLHTGVPKYGSLILNYLGFINSCSLRTLTLLGISLDLAWYFELPSLFISWLNVYILG